MNPLSGTVQGIQAQWRLYIVGSDGGKYSAPSPEWYAPQIGDTVVLGFYGGGEPYVASVLTPNRLRLPVFPPVPQITWGTTPPAGYVEAASVHVDPASGNLFLAMASPPPPPVAPSVFRFAPVGSDTWDTYFGDWRNDGTVYQAGGGNARGLWFYGQPFGVLAGLTPTRIQLTVTRYNGTNGSDGPVPVHVWLHSYPTQPAGEPAMSSEFIGPAIGHGEPRTFDLPITFALALKAGTAFGVGLYAGGDYLHALGAGDPSNSGLLTIDAA